MVLVLASFFFSGVAAATLAGDLALETLAATTGTSATTGVTSLAAETLGALALTTFLAAFLAIFLVWAGFLACLAAWAATLGIGMERLGREKERSEGGFLYNVLGWEEEFIEEK